MSRPQWAGKETWMKYLALLKDSLLEAIDTKVLYVMMGLSILLMLLVLCIGFTPVPVAELPVRYTTHPLNVDPEEWKKTMSLPEEAVLPRGPSPYSQVKVEPLDGAPDQPSSPLRFHIRALYRTPQEAARIRERPGESIDYIKRHFAAVEDWKILDVSDVQLIASSTLTSVDYEVKTVPTRATIRVWPHEPNLFFGAVPLSDLKQFSLGFQIWYIEDQLVNGLGAWLAILVSIILSAFFIPNMLRKGTVDLLLVKPIHRTTLLIYKYIGGLSFIFLNTATAVTGVWLVLGLRSGIWAPGFLVTIFIITFFFAILYSVSTLFGVLTGSPIVCIVMTCLVWFIFYAAGKAYVLPDQLRQLEDIRQTPPEKRISDGRWVSVVKAIHYVLPRAKDLDYLTSQLLFKNLLTSDQIDVLQLKKAQFSWSESVIVDGIFVVVMLGLSCARFASKDY